MSPPALRSVALTLLFAPALLAQAPPTRLPDSTRHRLLQCGSYGETLSEQVSTPRVRTALGIVASCPEGPATLAELWRRTTGSDDEYLLGLASSSSIDNSVIRAAVVAAMRDRSRPDNVRLRAMGVLLSQLTGDFGIGIWFQESPVQARIARDARGNIVEHPVDSVVRSVRFTYSKTPPVSLADAEREAILLALADISSDTLSTPDVRSAARAVRVILLDQRYSRQARQP